MTDRKIDSIRLPSEGVCVVTADGESLVITLPRNTGADGIERCHLVARGLMGTAHEFDGFEKRFGFIIRVAEPFFVARQIRGAYGGKSWDRVILENFAMDGMTHTTDIPGPFEFAVHQDGNQLDLLSAKIDGRRARRHP